MAKSLIITEKPSVAQEFAKILGVSGRNDGYIENGAYVITWCVGHLVEMVYPEAYDARYKKWRLQDLPFLPEQYKYNVIPAVKKQYDVVYHMLHRKDIDTVYWAGDAGKEGQTIEENIRQFGGVRAGMKELRVWIDSQTEEEILRGMREAKDMSEYDNLAKSGVMRTIEDYAMGINFSRVMSVKYGRMLNNAAGTKSYTAIAVGRVMTCVLGMVVIREREIRDFVETPFYRVIGTFSPAHENFVKDLGESIKAVGTEEEGAESFVIDAEWRAVEGSRYFGSPQLYKENGFKKRESAEALIDELTGKLAVVDTLEIGRSKKKAPLLFNLAELQAECSKRFKISPDETLQVVQDLYEKKLTTYPRTDARVLSVAVAKEIHHNIGRLKGYSPVESYVERIMKEGSFRNIAKTQYTDDSKITDHYAIIPTGQLTELKSLTSLQRNVFDVIVRRFLGIFYPPAEYQTVKLAVRMEEEKLFASAKSLKNPGYLEVTGIPRQREENVDDERENSGLLAIAMQLHKGDTLHVRGFSIRDGKTSPPKRYTSGSMVLAMENAGQLIEDEELRAQIKGSGIGTSATRAEIIKKLVRIGYLHLNKKTQVLSPENFGEMIFEVVNMTVPALLNPKMTASWEKGLDGITRGTVIMKDYREKLEDFIRRETTSMIEHDLTELVAERIHPFAGKGSRGTAIRKKLGVFCPICGEDMETTPFGYGCSAYKKDGTGCQFSIGAIAGRDLSEEEVRALLACGYTEVLSGFMSKAKKKFNARLKLETGEDGKKRVGFDFSENKAEIISDVSCPVCGREVQVTAFGFGCSGYEQDNPEGCRFAIGTLAGKALSVAQVKELLTNGRTQTIRGFRSKLGKKFDACVALVTDEEGRKSLRFDFEHTEAKKISDVSCPICRGDIVKTAFGFGCANYKKDDVSSCRFAIGKISEKSLTEAQVKELLKNGTTSVIRGFQSKSGKKFDASLKLTADGKVAFDFPEKPKPQRTEIKCPGCQSFLMKSQWYYACECGIQVAHTIAKVALTEEIIQELLTIGKTREKIAGFVSKSGKTFEACLKFQDGRVQFDFAQPGNRIERDERGNPDETADFYETMAEEFIFYQRKEALEHTEGMNFLDTFAAGEIR